MGRVGFDHRMIRSLLGRPDETVQALLRFTGEFRENRLMDLDEQVLDLFRHLRTPLAVPFYLHLSQMEDGIPDAVVEAFAELGSPAVEPLLKAYGERGVDDAPDIPFILAALGVRDTRILEILLETLRRDRYEGALCLSLYGDPQARESVELALPGADASEAKALRDCLESLGQDLPVKAVPEFDIYALYPEKADPEFGAMPQVDCLAFLECEDPGYRAAAAESFRDEDYPAKARARLLEHALHDTNVEVRAACWRALGEVSAEDRRVRAAMESVLRDSDRPREERLGALLGLAGASDIREMIHEFYSDPSTRAAALEAMWRTTDDSYESFFEENLDSEDLDLHRQALHGIGSLRLSKLAPRLIPLFENEKLREEALFAYALAAPGKTSVKGAEKLFSQIDQLSGGLTAEEADLLGIALDTRLGIEGLPPHFNPDHDDDDIDAEPEDGSHSPYRIQ